MYKVILSKNASKFLKRLDNISKSRIIAAIERIRIRPEAHTTKLVGETGYKLRVGDYRIILDIDKGKLRVLIIKIGHRRNIYKKQ